ncbi:ubiquinol-cytochrome c reductase iron-sulfur subunit [Thermodesulfovibrio sp.]|uniref:QcrA and Rieske domain-containing protein n=1 Tax=Thermodesulfovibrio sp. TaxID=2067987 RepID=UPI0030A44479
MPLNQKDEQLKRRTFLKKIIKFFFLSISFVFLILGIKILKPKNPRKREYKFFEIPEDKILRNGVRKVDINIDGEKHLRIYVISKEDTLIALSPVCTHLGCFVNFDKNDNEFVCPCHSGRYDTEGKVISGPPKEPLQRLPVKFENNKTYVGLAL